MNVLLFCDLFRYKGQAPDLLGKQDSVYEGEAYYERLKSDVMYLMFLSVCLSLISHVLCLPVSLQRTGTCWMLTKMRS